MTRAEYLSNSSKLLLICSCLLFAVNSLSFAGMYTDAFANLLPKLTNISFYVILVLGFLAFNGEGIAYKHSRQRNHKKKTVMLKTIPKAAEELPPSCWKWQENMASMETCGTII